MKLAMAAINLSGSSARIEWLLCSKICSFDPGISW
jgi:hypothetical protein